MLEQQQVRLHQYVDQLIDSPPIAVDQRGIINVLGIFDEIASKPRKSGQEHQEGGIGQYVREFARKRNLDSETDEAGNMLIRIPPTSPEYAHSPGLILQAHMDMVCKSVGQAHNPEKHAIIPVVSDDGQYIESKDRTTTLGADNGMSVAAMLALLDEKSPHGPRALLFTVREEGGMQNGAGKLKFDLKDYKYLVNLDHEREKEVTIHSACSGKSVVSLDIKDEDKISINSQKLLKIAVKGLKGGHSGLEIGEKRANAIKLLGQTLERIGVGNFNLVSISGGSGQSAIPTDSEAVIAINPNQEKQIKRKLITLEKSARKYYTEDEDLKIISDNVETKPEVMLTSDLTKQVVEVVTHLPTGVKEKDDQGVVTSTNIGIINTDSEKIEILMMTRSAENELRNIYLDEIQTIAEKLGARIVNTPGYPTWRIGKDTDIVRLIQNTHRKALGADINLTRVHAGIELSYISQLYPHLQMLSIGPSIFGAHSENERVKISSVFDFYKFLKEIIQDVTVA